MLSHGPAERAWIFAGSNYSVPGILALTSILSAVALQICEMGIDCAGPVNEVRGARFLLECVH